MNPVDIMLGFGPLFGALLFCLAWLIQILTRIENRVTKLEVLIEGQIPPEKRDEFFHAPS